VAPLDRADHPRPEVVKAVVGRGGRALWFSRHPIARHDLVRRHVGLYGWSASMLRRLTALPEHPIERAEGLEQLRGLLAGYRLDTVDVAHPCPAVDTPQELDALRRSGRFA
jgi:3-deoxy-manno-octulosonate cytidylyltransferase (CMP-KDO synthetase)